MRPSTRLAAAALAALLCLAAPAGGVRLREAPGRRTVEASAAGARFSECAGLLTSEDVFIRRVLDSLDAGETAGAERPHRARNRSSAAEDEPEDEERAVDDARLYGISHHTGLAVHPHPGALGGAATSLALYPEKQGRIADVVNGTYSDRWSSMWAHYQDKLTQKLRKATVGPPLKKLQVLVVSPVSGSLRAVDDFEFNLNRLRNNTAGDTFHFALFHYDGEDKMWKERSWYNEAHGIVLSQNRPMCKAASWLEVEPKLVRQYDYIWLMDGDLRMDYFSWDLYRAVLTMLDPLVSQPAIVPKGMGERSTDLEELQMVGAYGRMFPVAREVERSESMAPLLSTRLWPAIYKRLTRNDPRTVWYTNTVWDILAQWGALSCGKTGVLVVNAAPVRHINCHDLLRRPNRTGNDCIRGCGHPDRPNCRPFSKRDREYFQDALQDYCPLKTSERLVNCSHIKYCREAVWKRSHIRQWMEESDSNTITPYLYRCNYTGLHVGFDAPCSLELAEAPRSSI